jgi:membrane protease YdiL (CAAX protease family)
MNGETAPILYPEPPPRRQEPFWGYQDLVLLIGLALPALLAAVLVVTLFSAVAGRPPRTAATVLALQFLAYGFWFVCLYALLKLRYGRPFWQSLAWVRPRASLVSFLAGGAALAFSVALLGAALRTPDIDMPMKELLRDKTSLALVGFFAVTLGPLCEELIFRGFLQPLLTRSLGAAAAILVTAAVFALPHGPQYAWSWQHVVLITLAGAVFGWVRHRSGSTIAVTVMHAGYNFVFFVALVAQWEDLSKQW